MPFHPFTNPSVINLFLFKGWLFTIKKMSLQLPFFLRSTTEINAVDVPIEAFLPGYADNSRLLSWMSVLIDRILVENISHFQEHFAAYVVEHVSHKFSAE